MADSKTFRPLTDDEEALLEWLIAEREWRAEQWAIQAEELRRLERVRLETQARAEFRRIKATHGALVAEATGLRRALLERHGPEQADYRRALECGTCSDSEYGPHGFPCDEYEFIRDRKGDES